MEYELDTKGRDRRQLVVAFAVAAILSGWLALALVVGSINNSGFLS